MREGRYAFEKCTVCRGLRAVIGLIPEELIVRDRKDDRGPKRDQRKNGREMANLRKPKDRDDRDDFGHDNAVHDPTQPRFLRWR